MDSNALIEDALTVGVGAVAGGLTNAGAVWMLFHPHEPVRVGPFLMQGAIPKNKAPASARRSWKTISGPGAATGAAVGPQIDAIKLEVAKLGDELGRRLVDYINADPPITGEPMKPEQLQAIRLKSAEDIFIAKEHIELGGDYKKAIDIYATALLLDPENADLKAALTDAQAKRFISPERFATVKKGMSEAEVIKLIGRPLARNVRDYPEKKVSAWYYTKNDTGEAAGIFFNEKKVVYSTDFNAVKRTEETAGG